MRDSRDVAAREGGEEEARIRSRGDWVEALDTSSGRVYYANAAGAVQWTRPVVFDDNEEEDAPQWVSAARRSDEFEDDGVEVRDARRRRKGE